MEQNKKVGIWVRVSTEDQARGDSPEHHEKRAKMYAESRGWEVVTIYRLEAMSGKSVMNYPETKQMLEDIHKGKISGIIFSKLARLARNTKELLDFADIFKAEEADLISLQEAIDTSSPAGRLFYTMIAAMAQWEREEIADRVAASIPIRAKMGKSLGGRPTLGFKWVNNELIIDEEYAPLRRLIFELFLKHKRKKTVATLLNEQGYRSRDGKKFTDMAIYHLLRDTAAKGERRANYQKRVGNRMIFKPVEEWVITPCPALVSIETWNECNRILDESAKVHKRKGPKPKHLLAGFVHCACGKKMYVFHRTKQSSFQCKACNNRIPELDLNEIYREQLKTFLLTDVDLETYTKKLDNELIEKEQLLLLAQNERVNIKKEIYGLIKMRARDEMTKDMFAEQYKPLEEKYLQLNDQLPELQATVDVIKVHHQSSSVVLQDAKDLYSKWEVLEFEDKRNIVELITDKIVVDKEDIHIKLSYLPAPTQNNNPPTTTPLPNSGKEHKNPRGAKRAM